MKLEDYLKEHTDDYGESRIELREDGMYLVVVKSTIAIALGDGLDGFHPVEEYKIPLEVARRLHCQLDAILGELSEE